MFLTLLNSKRAAANPGWLSESLLSFLKIQIPGTKAGGPDSVGPLCHSDYQLGFRIIAMKHCKNIWYDIWN